MSLILSQKGLFNAKMVKMIIFFGSSFYSIPVLEKLLLAKRRVLVISTKDKPAGRGNRKTANPLKKYAKQNKLTVFCPEILDQHSLKKIKTKAGKFELGVCCVYGKIIPKIWLDSFPKGILNVHPSLLPKYRGPSPAQFAILKGEKETGASIILMDEKTDHGPIVFQESKPILTNQTAASLYENLFSLAAKNINQVVDKQLEGKNTPKGQGDKKATFTRQIDKKDGFIDLKAIKLALEGKQIEKNLLSKIFQEYLKAKSFSPGIINRARRAFSPWPGIYTKIVLTKKGKPEEKILKILDSQMKKGKLEIKTVQLEGKSPVTFWQFCSAYPVF